jgi:beta-1,4-mannooligosaccharide/beta-1,4-mannosyl-N-acetylglucosamine phosphorylase
MVQQFVSPSVKMVGQALPNIPWEDRPAGSNAVLWRYSGNPIIKRDATPTSNSIFNSAAVPFKDKFAGVFRVDDTRRIMTLHVGHSDDGVNWEIAPKPIEWNFKDPELSVFAHRYDPRVVWLEDRYWVTWCNGYHGPTIGVGYTFDFEEFHFLENAFLPHNRNGVLFPRKINGKCSAAPAIRDTRRLAIFSTVRVRIWCIGAIIVL